MFLGDNMSYKIDRIESSMVKEISYILMTEVKDPNVKFVTVTAAKVTSDLSYAKIYVTVLNKEFTKDTLKALNNAKGFIRNELKERMTRLNNAILKINGLGKAYQIGGAYFLKYKEYNDFEKLWQYHLEGLFHEYLRGNTNAEKQLAELKKAYDNETVKNESINTDDGQQ